MRQRREVQQTTTGSQPRVAAWWLATAAVFAAWMLASRFVPDTGPRHAHASGDLASTSPSSSPATAPARPTPSLAQLIGLEQLRERLGDAIPTGKGILAGHVEGSTGDYLPDLKTPEFAALKVVTQSGPSKVNGHAHATARLIYGSSGLAPGIPAVHFFSTEDFLGARVLRVGGPQAPTASTIRLFSHSWIGPAGRYADHVLRRIDGLIDDEDVVMAVGVDNGANKPVPAMLASSYNAIAVGQIDGKSSGGFTTSEGAGRCKPDLVAPGSLTSFATPVVAAMAARLLEVADARPDMDDVRKAPLIKAVLLAGAQKPPGWKPLEGRPLDDHLGAGLVRIDRSYDILVAGRQGPGAVTPAGGWDFRSMRPADRAAVYVFELTQPVAELSIVVAWNRRILGTVGDAHRGLYYWLDMPRLANMDLALVRVDEKGGAVVASSVSKVDNVEHIHVANLPPGQYRFGVKRSDTQDESWSFAIAWRAGPTD